MVAERTGPRRWVVTGPRRAGKTSFCRHLAEQACSAGWDVAGVVSLPYLEGARKTGIQALDLRSGESRLLASNRPSTGAGLHFCNWHFCKAVLEWANGVLQNASPCDLLIVDEIGALELKAGGGFTAALPILAVGRYRCAVAAVRMELEQNMRALWPDSSSIRISTPEEAARQAEALLAEMSCFRQ